MIILGLCDSVESHACILKDGNLVAAISEERLSRIKADAGYPKKSIDKVLEIARLQPSNIDLVAVAGYDNGLFQSIYKPGAYCINSLGKKIDVIKLNKNKKYFNTIFPLINLIPHSTLMFYTFYVKDMGAIHQI